RVATVTGVQTCALPIFAEVDEDQTAMVATPRHPSVQLELATFVGGAQRAAVRGGKAAHARRVGNSTHARSVCSPLDMSRSLALRSEARPGGKEASTRGT